eukprot:CAMPEP_0171396254 /NCGR_PEP_ID=MMETSP0880-20121228/4495_1 /TAXON_ID=67004 /ORGANISM="Thalassiosira weissflogii, Strain CCMP1336" /LENGTH=387 /DNA_ID=CAMNT_0011909871 /DNA_START=1 /DNA_END=1164 /DNA_ORIENTATION=+
MRFPLCQASHRVASNVTPLTSFTSIFSRDLSRTHARSVSTTTCAVTRGATTFRSNTTLPSSAKNWRRTPTTRHSPTPHQLFKSIQIRHHRTDYDGPGNFDDRETKSHHSHDHSHSHSQDQDQDLSPDQKEALRQHLQKRYRTRQGTYARRAYTIGIGGPVGSGKTALTLALCRALRDRLPMGVVTNDIFTQEDAQFLVRNKAFGEEDSLNRKRILPVETGGCPHAAIREDVSANLGALEVLTRNILRDETHNLEKLPPLLLCESGGDNLAANFSSELADYTIYVIDVAGGDKVPRKGGPGITQSDLLVVNKIDLAEAVGASLEVMERDARKMRRKKSRDNHSVGDVDGVESGPTIFASVKNGVGVNEIIENILKGFEEAHRLVKQAR